MQRNYCKENKSACGSRGLLQSHQSLLLTSTGFTIVVYKTMFKNFIQN
jgi:hypothetical protein